MATTGKIQWGDEPPSDLDMFPLWLDRCSSVTVTPSRVQTKAHGRPTYSLQFFRKTDASTAGPSVSAALRSTEPRSSLPIFLHFAPLCLASEKLAYKPLKVLAVAKERGFTRPGYSQSDSVMQRRAEAIQALLTEALSVYGQKPTEAAASEALMLLWCASASAIRHKQKAKSDELILQRIGYWSSMGSAQAATAGVESGSGTPGYMSPPRGAAGGLVTAGNSEVATAFFDVSPKRTPQQGPASPAPGAASPWDPFKGSTPAKGGQPPAMQLEGGADGAEEGGPDAASSTGGSPEHEGDSMWNTIHRSNSTLTPGIARRASFRRDADDGAIRRTTSSNRQLRVRKPGQGPRPRGHTAGSAASASAAEEDLLAGITVSGSSQPEALPTIHSPLPGKHGTDLERIFAASPQLKGQSGGATQQQAILDDLFG